LQLPKTEKIVIAYSSKWFTPFVTDTHLTEFFGVIDESMYPREQFDSIISYLSTAVIQEFIEGYAEMKSSNYYNGLWQLSEIPFDRIWDNASVREYFGIGEA